MTDQLRAALGADADTPAGVDVGAVRERARHLRRRRSTVLAGTAAVLTAAAIVVPAGLLGGGGPGPDTGPVAAPAGTTAIPAGCPDQLPTEPVNTGPGLADRLIPFAPEEGLVCGYFPMPRAAGPGPLNGVLRLSARDLAATVARMNGPADPAPEPICTADAGDPILLRVAGEGRVAILRLQPWGCGDVTNGTREQRVDPNLLRSLSTLVGESSNCPARLSGAQGLPSIVSPGPTLLPADTTRILVCLYPNGENATNRDFRWNAAVEPAATRTVVTSINAAPPVPENMPCTMEGGRPRVLIVAVAPQRVQRLLGSAGNCRDITDGKRRVLDPESLDLLLRLAQQR